ncbi:General negative regulator of transcription subunit 2 [Dictyocoela muelleri]|nr:General negative regulator of transcription subunit 2 [Dictyocoela muelleri]
MSDEKDNKYLAIAEDIENGEKLFMPKFPLYNYPQNSAEQMIPNCYKNIPIKLANLERFGDETLIYIYFNISNPELQDAALVELKKRDVYYSITDQCFVFLNCKKEICAQKKRVVFFDHVNWNREEKEVFFDKNFISSLKD